MPENTLVRFENEDGIGVITIDNPPVNALSPGVPEGIIENIERGNADPAIKAMVLIGAGRSFIAGADIRTFGNRPPPVLGKRAHDALDASQKPVVAAIHGYALGGGFEIALASNYRIAVPSAKVGLPEVLIGILPGSGGTQRLPRLIGPKAALEMIVSGRHVPAEEAKRLGIIDELVAGGRRSAPRRVSPLPAASPTSGRCRASATMTRSSPRPRPIPASSTRCANRSPAARATRRRPIIASPRSKTRATMPFDDGVARERELFNELENSAEARALRYAFFAEREVARLPDIPRDTPLRPIKTAAIVGAGTMGGGIAMSFAEFGFPVKLLEVDEDALARGLARIRANYQTSVNRGSLSTAEMERRLGLIEGVQSYDDIAQADVVIEAVFERIPVKEEVFAKLDATMKPGALLFSNTSGIDIDIMANATKRPQDVAGTHFFAPANVMKLFEVVRGRKKRARHPDDGDGSRPQDRQDQRDGRQLRRLCRQPQPHPVRHRDEHHGRGGLPARAGRQGDGRFRLPDRAVRDRRPVRARHRL